MRTGFGVAAGMWIAGVVIVHWGSWSILAFCMTGGMVLALLMMGRSINRVHVDIWGVPNAYDKRRVNGWAVMVGITGIAAVISVILS